MLGSELRLVAATETDGRSHARHRTAGRRGRARHATSSRTTTSSARSASGSNASRARPARAGRSSAWPGHGGVAGAARQRQLPSLLEWVGILRHIPPSEWSADERRLMRATARHYLTRGVAALAVLAAVALGIKSVRDRDRAESRLRTRHQVRAPEPAGTLPEIAAHRDRVRLDLERVEGDNRPRYRDRVNAVLLFHRERPTASAPRVLRAGWARPARMRLRLIRDVLADRPRDGRQRSALEQALRDDSARMRSGSASRACWRVLRRWRTRSGSLPPAPWSGASSAKTAARTRSGSRCSARRTRSSCRSWSTSAPTRRAIQPRGPPPRRRWPGRSRPRATRRGWRSADRGPARGGADPAPELRADERQASGLKYLAAYWPRSGRAARRSGRRSPGAGGHRAGRPGSARSTSAGPSASGRPSPAHRRRSRRSRP